jgi:hypothetical protein
MRLGVGRNILDPETEAKLISTEPKMEIEVNDIYRASTIGIKFIAFKTP